MTDVRLYLVSASKSRPGGVQWSDDDYDVAPPPLTAL
jgi:hypothetical protein